MRSEPRARVLLAALGLAGILGAAQAARAATLTFSTSISGDPVLVTLELSDAPGGDAVDVAVSIPEGAGDVLGVFGNVVTPSLVAGMGVDDRSGIVTQYQFELDGVHKVGAGNTLSPVKGWDWGVKLGATGSPGGEVVERASFRLTGPGLTVAELIGAVNQGWVLAVRVQSTSGAEGSSKKGLSADAPRLHIDAPPGGALLAASPASVTGRVLGSGVAVDVNGVAASVTGTAFLAEISLVEGPSTILASATNAQGTATDAVAVVIDTTPPAVTISDPPDGTLTAEAELVVQGTVADASPIASLRVNGADVPLVDGAFSTVVPLAPGDNSIEAVAVDAAGHTGSKAIAVVPGEPPSVAITSPLDGALVAPGLVTVSGTVTGLPEPSVVVNGVVAAVAGGAFSAEIPVTSGALTFTATATNALGSASAQVLVTAGVPPTVEITAPADGLLTNQSPIAVSGTVTGTAPVSIQVNGIAAVVSGGSFSASVPLAEGANPLTATATNAFGQTQATVSVTRDSTPPVVTIASPAEGAAAPLSPIQVAGTVIDASAVTSVRVNGTPATLIGSSYEAIVLLAPGENLIAVTATDAAGNTGTAGITVIAQECVPGETQACFDGPPGTEGVGICSAGTQTCLADGSGFGPCDGQTLPATEICNGFDDDCDANIDEGFDVGRVCDTGGEGICAQGAITCQAGAPVCQPASGPQDEICDDGIDQNCDGRDCLILSVTIDGPMDELVTAETTVDVTGTVGPGVTSVDVNRVPASLTGSGFVATVPLDPGPNMIVAVGTDDLGNAGTDSVQMTLDDVAPRVKMDSPQDGFVTAASSITVTGVVNDTVRGGVEPGVFVNGIEATVARGTFMAVGVPLVPGPNTIIATATDAVGNSGADQIQVVSSQGVGPRLEILSGDGQAGLVRTLLPEPLAVRVVDEAGNPLASRLVHFSVSRNDGLLETPSGRVGRSVAVATNGAGVAQVSLRLGSRTGEGNHRVRVSSSGVAGEAEFCAAGLAGVPERITATMGGNQTGIVGSPLPEPFEVLVVDSAGNPVSGVEVDFLVEAGDGHFGGLPVASISTNADGLARATLTLGPNEGLSNQVVTASFSTLLEEPAGFVASAVAPDPSSETALSGTVLDNADMPIPEATVSIDGTELVTLTGAEGQFRLEGLPVGSLLLEVDPSTTTRPETFPPLAFEVVTISGRENRLPTGPIRLPPLPNQGVLVGGSEEVTISVPGLEGVELIVAPNSVTFAEGSRTGLVSVNQVHLDKLPMPPLNNAPFVPALTIQPAGTRFDPPARLRAPNTQGLPPGAIVDIASFDHDQNRFVVVGTATVSDDGASIVSDPGFGIELAGWHGATPPPPPIFCGSECNDCQFCLVLACVANPLATTCDDQNACTGDGNCNGGECEDGEFGANFDIPQDDPTRRAESEAERNRLVRRLRECQAESPALRELFEDLCMDTSFASTTWQFRDRFAYIDNLNEGNTDMRDLDDIDLLRPSDCIWATTSCQHLVHIVAERIEHEKDDRGDQEGGSDAHQVGLEAERRFQAERGLEQRIVDSVNCFDAPGSKCPCNGKDLVCYLNDADGDGTPDSREVHELDQTGGNVVEIRCETGRRL